MDTTATCTGHSTTGRRLYLALELSNTKWKLGFTVGMVKCTPFIALHQTDPDERSIASTIME